MNEIAGPKTQPASRPADRLRRFRALPWVQLVLLVVTWVVLPLVPDDSGLKFGLGYQALFTAMVLLGSLTFWLLRRRDIGQPRGTFSILVSLGAVFLVTVAILVVAGAIYPQFDLPQPAGEAGQDASARGEGLFWSDNVGCFRCHAISGTGGTRGPDLTDVASRAGERVAGLTAQQYLMEKIGAGASYRFLVPEYVPMMPQFDKLLTDDQMRDLVAYLLSLEQASETQ